MANITVSVPDEVYRRARIKAAEEGESVSSMVTRFLTSLDDSKAEFDRLLALQEEVMAEIEDFDGSDRLSRDEIHSRAIR